MSANTEKVTQAIKDSAESRDRPMEQVDGSNPFLTVFFPYLIVLALVVLVLAAIFLLTG